MHPLRLGITGVLALFALPAMAEERTITLAVENMFCAACPHIVSRSLGDVAGVIEVEVSDADKTATVVFDDARTGIAELITATTDAGYPSAERSRTQ